MTEGTLPTTTTKRSALTKQPSNQNDTRHHESLGAALQRIGEQKDRLEQLAAKGEPAIQQEIRKWGRGEAQVLDFIASEEALLEDRYEGYEQD